MHNFCNAVHAMSLYGNEGRLSIVNIKPIQQKFILTIIKNLHLIIFKVVLQVYGSCHFSVYVESSFDHQNVLLKSIYKSSSKITYLTRALTVDLTTLESRKRGVTRMWKRESEAKATEGEKSASSNKWA